MLRPPHAQKFQGCVAYWNTMNHFMGHEGDGEWYTTHNGGPHNNPADLPCKLNRKSTEVLIQKHWTTRMSAKDNLGSFEY